MNTRPRRLLPNLLVLCAAAVLGACATAPAAPAPQPAAAPADAVAPPPPPASVSAGLLPDLSAGADERGEQRFDLNVVNAEARAFFMSLVRETPYNVFVHPEVAGRVTLQLNAVSVPEVMDAVRDIYGYEIRRNGAGWVVMPATLQTRVFQVNYLNLVRSGRSQIRVSSGQATQVPLQNAVIGGSAQPQQATAEGGLDRGAGAKIETSTESDFWTALRDTVTAIVGDGEGRRVVVNANSGLVVVRALPAELRNVADYLAASQAIATRQVVLEAKIVEVELSEQFQSGINWSALNIAGGNTLSLNQAGGPNLFTDGVSSLQGAPVTVAPGNPLSGFDTTAFGGAFALAFNSNDFNAFIELLGAQGTTRVLSSPRVATVNNQKAVIKVGSDEFFATGVQSQTVTGTATQQQRQILLTPFFSGIALDVTPQISEQGEVILHVHPSVTEVTDQTKTFKVADTEDQLPLALSNVREADSVVRAKSGQLVVIGGLMRSSTSEQEVGVPGLKDVPLVGNLFKHRRDVERKSELVILIRPIVITDDAVWDELAREPTLGGPR